MKMMKKFYPRKKKNKCHLFLVIYMKWLVKEFISYMRVRIMTNKIRDLDVKLDIINKLLEIIKKYPEERICQIIYNSLRLHMKNNGDIFYVDDLKLLDNLNRRLE